MIRFPSAIRAVCFQLGKARQITGRAHAEWLREAFRQRAIRLPCVPQNGNWPELPSTTYQAPTVAEMWTRCSCQSFTHCHARRNRFLYLRRAVPPHTMWSIQQMYKCVRVFGDEPSRQSCIRRQSDVVTRYFFSFWIYMSVTLNEIRWNLFLSFSFFSLPLSSLFLSFAKNVWALY